MGARARSRRLRAGTIRGAPDDQLEDLTLQLGRNRLLLDQADSAGIVLNELQWLGVRQGYQASVDSLRVLLNLGSDVTDSTLTAAQRSDIVQLKIEGYFNLVAAGRIGLMAPPPALPSVLRRDQTYNVSLPGVGRAALMAADLITERGQGAAPVPAGGSAVTPPGNLYAVIGRAALLAVLVVGVVAPAAWSQDPALVPVGSSTPVDWLVAVVGNQAILNSHVEEAMFQRQTEGVDVPPDGEGRREVRLQIIDELISTELMVQQALRDTTIIR